jgi:hypothetical protein
MYYRRQRDENIVDIQGFAAALLKSRESRGGDGIDSAS